MHISTVISCYEEFLLDLVVRADGPARCRTDLYRRSERRQKAEFKERIKTTSADADYFNEARYRAERAAIRKERNFLEFGTSLQGTLTSYNDAWIESAGGDNSIAVIAALRLHHIFTKEKFTIETKAEGKFGYNRMRVENADGSEEASGSRIRTNSRSRPPRHTNSRRTGRSVRS